MKFRLPRRRLWRAAIYIVCTLLILAAIDLIVVHAFRRIPRGHDTTRITEPTLPDGRVDYLTAIEQHFGADVTPENNAAMPMLEALGRKALPANQPRDGITDRLGMPPLADAGDYFVNDDDFAKQSESKTLELPQEVIERPWEASDHPLQDRWLTANAKPFAKLIEASKRPRFFIPFNGGYRAETLWEIQIPYLLRIRQASTALTARAQRSAGAGDFDAARQDLLTVHRLGRLIAQDSTLIGHAVGYGIDIRASAAEQSIAAEAKLTASQPRQWAGEIAALPALPSPADPIDFCERFMFLDGMQLFAHVGPTRTGELVGLVSSAGAKPGPGTAFAWNFLPVRYAYAMREGNKWYDRMVAAAKRPTHVQRRSEMARCTDDLNAVLTRHSAFARLLTSDWPLGIFLPGLNRIVNELSSAEMNAQLAQVAMALAAFKAERGAYPQSLAELSPEYLTTVPGDLFVDKPLIYRSSAKAYLLYSVGPNEIDESGVNTSARNASGKRDDLTVRGGLSAVPATAPAAVPASQ